MNSTSLKQCDTDVLTQGKAQQDSTLSTIGIRVIIALLFSQHTECH